MLIECCLHVRNYVEYFRGQRKRLESKTICPETRGTWVLTLSVKTGKVPGKPGQVFHPDVLFLGSLPQGEEVNE